MIKLILADDHTLIREGLKALLKEEKTIEVAAEARNTEELLSINENVNADVVLLDFSIPSEECLENIRKTSEKCPDLKILVLSLAYNDEDVADVFRAGALGYIHQNSEKDELIYAIHTVHKGNKFISPFISLNLLEKAGRPTKSLSLTYGMKINNRLPVDISNREKEVLMLIAQGYTNAEIADKLFTSKRTIESHRKNLIDKTKTKNTASLIRFAFTNGMLSN